MSTERNDVCVRRLWRTEAWGYGLLFVFGCAAIAPSIYEEFAFLNHVVAMSRRMAEIGGGFSHGRRSYSRQVLAWDHDPSVTDDHMGVITSVLRDWQRGGRNSDLSLDLSGTSVSDTGLAALREIQILRSVDLKRTKITAAGVGFLQRGNSRIKIYRDGDSSAP